MTFYAHSPLCTCLTFLSRNTLRVMHSLHLQCLQKLCNLHLCLMQLLIERLTLPQTTFCICFLRAQSCVHMLDFLELGILRPMHPVHLHCLQKLF